MFLLTNGRCYYRTYGNKEACESKFAGFWVIIKPLRMRKDSAPCKEPLFSSVKLARYNLGQIPQSIQFHICL